MATPTLLYFNVLPYLRLIYDMLSDTSQSFHNNIGPFSVIYFKLSFTSSPLNTSRSFHWNTDHSYRRSFSLSTVKCTASPSEKRRRIHIAMVAQNVNWTNFGILVVGEDNTTSISISLLIEKATALTWSFFYC